MKIIFFGTSVFAVRALKKLREAGHEIPAVVTQPDRKRGRDLQPAPPPVKEEALNLKLRVLQPEDVSEEGFISSLKDAAADLFVVVSFGGILSKALLDIPRISCLNIHASLLPKYRGAAPVKWAIANGEKETGVTIMRMSEQMDAGDIVLQKKVKVDARETSVDLDGRLSALGADLLPEAIELIMGGKAEFAKQDEKDATYAPKLRKEDGHIDWGMDTESILNRIRGFKPWPGTYSYYGGSILKIIEAKSQGGEGFSRFSPGMIAIADIESGLIVRTGDGAVSIKELQIEGKRRMNTELFLRGHKLAIGTKLA